MCTRRFGVKERQALSEIQKNNACGVQRSTDSASSLKAAKVKRQARSQVTVHAKNGTPLPPSAYRREYSIICILKLRIR